MKLLLTLTLALALSDAAAQILNVEQQRKGRRDTTDVWIGTAALTANLLEQQVQVLTFSTQSNVTYLSGKHSYLFVGNGRLVRNEGNNLVSDAYLHGRINLWRARLFSGELFAQGQYDVGRGLRNRALAGAGLRWHFAEQKKYDISFGPGIMHEREVWQQPIDAEVEDSTVTNNYLKSTNYLTVSWTPRDNLAFALTTYYQARFVNFFAPRIIGEAAFDVKITKLLAFTSRFALQYDAAPVLPTVDPLNYNFSNGIALQF